MQTIKWPYPPVAGVWGRWWPDLLAQKKARSWGDRARRSTTGGTDMAPTIKVWADETLSSRCWRLSLAGTDWPRKLVDGLFLLFGELDHCREAYESERLGRQLPPELRR